MSNPINYSSRARIDYDGLPIVEMAVPTEDGVCWHVLTPERAEEIALGLQLQAANARRLVTDEWQGEVMP